MFQPQYRYVALAGPAALQVPEALARGVPGRRAALRLGEDRRQPLRHVLHRPREQAHPVREPRAPSEARPAEHG